jgi:hypothetical protein
MASTVVDPRRIRRGNTVVIRYEIRDTRGYPPGKLVDPDGGAQITIVQPDGTVAITLDDMTKVEGHPDFPRGLYEYLYQTFPDSPLGAWLAECKETHLSFSNISLLQTAFILEP